MIRDLYASGRGRFHRRPLPILNNQIDTRFKCDPLLSPMWVEL